MNCGGSAPQRETLTACCGSSANPANSLRLARPKEASSTHLHEPRPLARLARQNPRITPIRGLRARRQPLAMGSRGIDLGQRSSPAMPANPLPLPYATTLSCHSLLFPLISKRRRGIPVTTSSSGSHQEEEAKNHGPLEHIILIQDPFTPAKD